MAYPGYGGYGGPPPGVPVQGMSMPGGPMGGPMGGAGPAGFPGYSAYPGNFAPPPVNDPMWSYFRAIAGQDGEIDSEELQRCLTQTGVGGTYTPFSLETCRIMIAMLDVSFTVEEVDMTGKMGFNEFKELFAALNGWKQNFMMFDQDRSGTVEPHEMAQAVSSMGYRISPNTLNGIIKRYSKGGRIAFDDYVACCVKLRSLTDAFRRRDGMQQGAVSFQYDDFLQCTMTI